MTKSLLFDDFAQQVVTHPPGLTSNGMGFKKGKPEGRRMEKQLIFLISTPRSGSTLLMRILNATQQIYARPEPHMIPALAHLGFWETVGTAPYDQLQAQQAMRGFVRDLPEGSDDYYAACRAYTDHLYGRMFSTAEGNPKYFLDKTPANALVLPFLENLYPKAKYIVLTRHPAAIFASFANSFFDGDYQAAVKFNPILSRYIPVMARFLRETQCPHLHVSYEEIATNPEAALERISTFLDIPFDAGALDYQRANVTPGLGDPIGVNQHQRPVTSSIHKWAEELAANASDFEIVSKQLAGIQAEDMETWGQPLHTLWAPLAQADPNAFQARKKSWNRHALTRRFLVWLRRDIHQKILGRLVKKVRFVCDVLLRG